MRKSFIEVDSESDDEYKELSLRIYVIGKAKAGKTSFIKRMLYNEFSILYTPTRAVEIYNKKSFYRHNLLMHLQFVDIPEGFRLKDSKVSDVLAVVCNDTLPTLPELPMRTWFLYRNKIDIDKCPLHRQIRIDNMENVGCKAFLNSIIHEYT